MTKIYFHINLPCHLTRKIYFDDVFNSVYAIESINEAKFLLENMEVKTGKLTKEKPFIFKGSEL